jgi:ADP-ribosylglycohydrolase
MLSSNLNASSRIVGGLYGLLIGDALGVPYEFHGPRDIPPREQIEFDPPAGYNRAHRTVHPGTWSDDGAQALCLLDSLLERGRFDPQDFADRIVRWHDDGYLAVNGIVFDVGVTTSNAISALKHGEQPLLAGPSDEYDNGNGSLMRVLPLALWHRGSDTELVSDAHDQSKVTHGHPRSLACCALYCLWARNILNDAAHSWDSAVSTLTQIYSNNPVLSTELTTISDSVNSARPKGTGYVVDSLASAKSVQSAGSYEQIVKAAIALGNDTDTTACIAGGIAGMIYGIEGVPTRWREHLRGQELVKPLLNRLIETL